MAALIGVDVDRTISITFVIGAALAAVAGALYMMYYGVVNFSDGFLPGVKAFTAAVLGGIGSLPGAVLGGLVDRPHRSVLVGLFLDRLQGRRGVLDPGHHPDLHALGHSRPTRNREGVSDDRDFARRSRRRERRSRRHRLKDAAAAAALAVLPLLSDHSAARRGGQRRQPVS